MKVRLVALVPVLGALVLGCSSGSEPAQPPPLPSPTSAAVTPTAASASVPAEAAGTSPQSAAAFVRFYYEQLGQAFVTLDSSKIRPLFASSCSTCARTADNIDTERATGRRYSGGGVTVRVAEAVAVDANRTVVSTVFDSEPLVLETGPGAPSPLPARDGVAVEVELVRSGDSWLVARVVQP